MRILSFIEHLIKLAAKDPYAEVCFDAGIPKKITHEDIKIGKGRVLIKAVPTTGLGHMPEKKEKQC